GVTPSYYAKLRLQPMMGRVLDDADGQERRRVCVIRARLLNEAKYVGDPLKLDLKIGSEFFRVVGVLPDAEFQSPNKTVLRIDDRAMEVYVPFETVVSRFGVNETKERSGSFEATRIELHQLVCAVSSEDKVLSAARGVQAILTTFHAKKDYEITVP